MTIDCQWKSSNVVHMIGTLDKKLIILHPSFVYVMYLKNFINIEYYRSIEKMMLDWTFILYQISNKQYFWKPKKNNTLFVSSNGFWEKFCIIMSVYLLSWYLAPYQIFGSWQTFIIFRQSNLFCIFSILSNISNI